jgi:hypothetical protein
MLTGFVSHPYLLCIEVDMKRTNLKMDDCVVEEESPSDVGLVEAGRFRIFGLEAGLATGCTVISGVVQQRIENRYQQRRTITRQTTDKQSPTKTKTKRQPIFCRVKNHNQFF